MIPRVKGLKYEITMKYICRVRIRIKGLKSFQRVSHLVCCESGRKCLNVVTYPGVGVVDLRKER